LPAEISQNPHVPKFLWDRKKMVWQLPGMYSSGEESEAILGMANFAEA